MANDTVSMTDLFPICHQILLRVLTPIHYVELTERALNEIGLTSSDVRWDRQIEDVREKLEKKSNLNVFYTGKPACLVGLTWWFGGPQLRLALPTDGIRIPGNATSGAKGAFEALMRDPYMMVKKLPRHVCNCCGRQNLPIHLRIPLAQSRGNGLVIEQHISDWVKLNWPEFWLPPDNANKYKQKCSHDFKLNIDNKRPLLVDVTGRKLNGSYGNPGKGKRRVDIHMICEIRESDVWWISTCTGKDYNEEIYPDIHGFAPERMIVWLNCMQAGFDYEAIKLLALGEKPNA